MRSYIVLMILFLSIFISNSFSNENNLVKIYISADRTGTKASGISIEQGIRTALSEVNYQILDKKIELEILDHRGNTKRAKKHLDQYLKDENALVLFSGLHSPPLLSEREFICENKILVLDPWAAAGPITRYPGNENWIFRLSIDDSKAGEVIAETSIKKEKLKKPYLLLENTGWGKSNKKTMQKSLLSLGIDSVGVDWFNWGIGINQAKVLLRKIKKSGSDVIFFVGNAPEGKIFVKAMTELTEKERIPIRSHWGITGGDFPEVIDKSLRDKVNLKFIQTTFSFINNKSDIAKKVLNQAKSIYPSIINSEYDIKAPTGFIHSYDLTKILISAIKQAGFSNDIASTRNKIRIALENLKSNIRGLIKVYNKPFSKFSDKNYDAHEALGKKNFVMAEYGSKNEIILIK